jgi:hypothetical protein
MCALEINSEKFPGLQLGIRAPACAMRRISQVCCEGLHPSAFKGLATVWRRDVQTDTHHFSHRFPNVPACHCVMHLEWVLCLGTVPPPDQRFSVRHDAHAPQQPTREEHGCPHRVVAKQDGRPRGSPHTRVHSVFVRSENA